MTTHELRCAPAYFERVWDGSKPFEVRWDDRVYQAGDHVVLHEWDVRRPCDCPKALPGQPRHHEDLTCARYSGRFVEATIGHVMASTAPRGQQPGFQGSGYVVFGLVGCDNYEPEPKPEPVPLTITVQGADVAGNASAALQRVVMASQVGGGLP